MYILRSIESIIKSHLFLGKIILIYGARQTGKTTLVKKISQEIDKPSTYFNCDEPDKAKLFQEADSSTELKEIIGNNPLVIIDEAQQIENIGLKLKLLVDNYPGQQIIATGSSSFELANNIIEPLTGRNFAFWLHPLSVVELDKIWDKWEMNRHLGSLLIYGSYPETIKASSLEEKEETARRLALDYLYKDILKFFNLKNSHTVHNLLSALALQVGQEVSFTELANLIGSNKETVASYIEILEQAFVIFRLQPFSRNLRKELGKLRKIYFYDLGIRNAIINSFNPLSQRNDIGALWENFIVAEMKKKENFIGHLKRYFFWRTYDQQEIDLVEERDGKLYGYEIKWQRGRKTAPKAWRDGYPNSSWQTVDRENYLDFLNH